MSTKNHPKLYFPKPFSSRDMGCFEALLKCFLCGWGLMSDVRGEQLLVYLVYLRGKVILLFVVLLLSKWKPSSIGLL